MSKKTQKSLASAANQSTEAFAAAPKLKKKHRGLKSLAIISIIGGAAFFVVRRVLMPRDDGWTPQEPGTGYNTDDYGFKADAEAFDTEDVAQAEPVADVVEAPAQAEKPAEAPAQEDAKPKAAKATKSAAKKSVPDDIDPEGNFVSFDTSRLASNKASQSKAKASKAAADAGYRGSNPPEGYTIKADSKAKKYYTPISEGFSAVKADVWFMSTEEAEGAGFNKAAD